MQSAAQPIVQSVAHSNRSLWTGRVLSGLVAAFMAFDAVIHLLRPVPVVVAFAKLGYPLRLAVTLGIIELVCVFLYVTPRTSILGAILLSGYLGGAIATQLPTSNSLFGEILFPVYVGVVVWGGIYLRDDRLRALLPLRS
jgi:hypothetical protein